jgi:Zn-dependent protease with chaperone function
MTFDPRLRSSRERPLFVVGVVFSSVVWLALVVTIVGILYGVLILLGMLMAHALFLAHIRGNGVRVSERQLPDLNARVRAASEKLGLPQPPEAYVIQAGGVLNAFATKLLSRKYVILFADLVDQCHEARQLDFVVGHEIGHLAAGHLRWNAFLAPYHLVPWLGPAYSRAREYTCDRCGFLVAGDLEQSMRGLVVLAAGGRVAGQVDLSAFTAQLLETGGFWMAVLELSASHPFLCKRAAALKKLTKADEIAAVRRNPFAWIFAPVFGAMSGGSASAPLVVIAMIGILAAIAIPSFIKYQERARQAGLQSGGPAAVASALAGGDDGNAVLTPEDRESLEWVKKIRARMAAEEEGEADGPSNTEK